MQQEQKPSSAFRAADLLWRGSQIVAGRIPAGLTAWVGEGKERNDRVLRRLVVVALIVVPLLIAIRPKTWSAWLAVAGLTGAILVAARVAPILAVILVVSMLATTAPALMWVALIAWVTAAVLAALPKKKAKAKKCKGKKSKKEKERPADTPRAPATDAVETPAVDPLPGILADLLGDASGVHLKTVVQYLHRTGLDRSCTQDDVIAALDRRGIRWRPSVRDARDKVNKGVHGDDLRAWLDHSPSAPTQTPPRDVATPATTPVTSGVANVATAPTTPATAPRGVGREGFDAHADDALGLVTPRRHGA